MFTRVIILVVFKTSCICKLSQLRSSKVIEKVSVVVDGFVLGVCHGTGICSIVLFARRQPGDIAINLDIIGLGTLSFTVLCTNCRGYVLCGTVNGR